MGERVTLCRAFSDYVEDNGRNRDPFIPGPLEWRSGAEVDSPSFLPRFGRVVADACALFRGGAPVVQLGNSRFRIYSSDFNLIGNQP